jgi:hypothetical protein
MLVIQDLNKVSPITSDNSLVSIGSWVAFDMEWESDSAPITQEKTPIIGCSHRYNNEVTSEHPKTQICRITNFAYEDTYGNTKAIDTLAL